MLAIMPERTATPIVPQPTNSHHINVSIKNVFSRTENTKSVTHYSNVIASTVRSTSSVLAECLPKDTTRGYLDGPSQEERDLK